MFNWLKSVVPIAAILVCSAMPHADWTERLPPLFVTSSEAIVIGTLDSVSEVTRGDRDVASGTLRVSRVLHGKAKPGETLTLGWNNITGLTSPRTTYETLSGHEALWFLTKRKDGAYAADYPSRVYALNKRQDLEELQIKLQEAISEGVTDRRFTVVNNFLQEFLYLRTKDKQ